MSYYKGINNLELDLPDQVEHNRRGVADNKQSIATLQSQVNQLLSQNPAGFLPQVYYGLTRGDQTYRFTDGYEISVEAEGNLNDSYEIIANNETAEYISAVGVKSAEDKVTVVIQGDYTIAETEFTLINTRTGSSTQVTLSGVLSLQDASYLGEFQAQDNKEKQITVLKDLQSGQNNAIYASIDRNGDGVFNWTRIGGYVNGTDGTSIYAATGATMSTTLSNAKANDIILIGETFTYNDVEYAVGNLYKINTLDPLDLELRGNIRGAQGATGETGASGADGADGYTPYIQDGYWYINGTNTNVQAIGQNGTNGQDGQSFNIQSGLYSVPANYGQTGNVDAQGNPLLQLPALPQVDISGKGYVVYDPLTTPLDPYYDLYYANDNDVNWTIVHPFSGIKGQDGTDGYTPYIQNGYWYINSVNTGVAATGPQGPTGPTGAEGTSTYRCSITINASTTSLSSFFIDVPQGRTIKPGDILIGTNGNIATVTAYSNGTATISSQTVGLFTGPIVPIGGILMWSTSLVPANYLVCDGSAVSRTTYAELFLVIGTTYGTGDGSTTFNLPNLTERFVLGAGSNYALGATGGSKDAVVVSHSHTFTGNNKTGYIEAFPAVQNGRGAASGVFSNTDSGSDYTYTGTSSNTRKITRFNFSMTPSGTISTNGESGTGKNMPPYIALNYIIRAL